MNVPAARYLRSDGLWACPAAAAQPEQQPDQRWRGDEQDDQAFDDVHDVERDAGGGLHDRAAGVQRAEQQRGKDHAQRPGPAEQRDRDAVEAVRAIAVKRQRRRLALHDRARREPGQAAGDQECEHPDPFHVNAGAACRARARAHGPELEAQRAAREQPCGRGRGGQCDQEPDADLRWWPPHVRQHGVSRDVRRDRVGLTRCLHQVMAGQQEGQEVVHHVVEHDREDDLVRAGPRLQLAHDPADHRAADEGADDADDGVQHDRQVDRVTEPGRDQRAADPLACCADVEHAGPET